jgi:hypothetical protein
MQTAAPPSLRDSDLLALNSTAGGHPRCIALGEQHHNQRRTP